MLPACDPDQHQFLSPCWRLEAGRAISLRTRDDGVLRVVRGQIWATLDETPVGPAHESGDHFLGPGQQLSVRAGRHLVIESADGLPVHFVWLAQCPSGSTWQALRELGHAAALTGRALTRLLAGVTLSLGSALLTLRRR